ncbi:MAG: hypothetical protein J5858_16530, partial [Lentisphaeria bacterium]|nr:hypothetical protein [Lentisphaeria bacterium]
MSLKKEYSFSLFEKIVYVLVIIISILGFSYSDIAETSYDALIFLDACKAGEIRHFYSYAYSHAGYAPAYDLIYYLVLGIWELPLWILDRFLECPLPVYIRVCWCKILLGLCSFFALVLTEKLI